MNPQKPNQQQPGKTQQQPGKQGGTDQNTGRGGQGNPFQQDQNK